jgi:hypothetical protein
MENNCHGCNLEKLECSRRAVIGQPNESLQRIQEARNVLHELNYKLQAYIYPNVHFDMSGHRFCEDVAEVHTECTRHIKAITEYLGQINKGEVGLDFWAKFKQEING